MSGHQGASARLAARRLAAQQIGRHTFARAADLVAWMGAMQAQDYAAVHWAVGLRLRGRAVGEAALAGALADGSVVHTHVMRWTWQLVAPADLLWMLPLVAPRLMNRTAGRHRELNLDAATFARSTRAIERALAKGAHLTRAELGGALRDAGVATDGPRLSHLLGHAELHAVICSGAPRAKQRTYALVASRLPREHEPLEREEALAELARRYFRSRGPATAADFAWWSGLAPAEARAGLAAIRGELASEEIEGATLWRDAKIAPTADAVLAEAALLPPFDEYLIAYRDRGDMLAPHEARRLNAGGGILPPVIVAGGRVVGRWRRTLAPSVVTIELAPFDKPSPADRARIGEAAERYAAFLDRQVKIVWRRR